MEEQEQVTKTVATASRLSAKKKFLLFAGISMVNLFGLAAASIAWFNVIAKEASIDAVSGDLNVDIKKVTAYKYVYPFYEGSTEFINYDGEGQIKSYIVEDASITDAVNDDPVEFTLSKASGTCLRSPGASSPTSIYYHYQHDYSSENKDIRYFLMGDSVFTGTNSDSWSTLTSVPLSSTADASASIDNVVVSKGAKFMFFDADGLVNTSCSYFSYATNATNGRFKVVDGVIECLKSGIYSFSYVKTVNGNTPSYSLTISLSGRSDEAIIGNGIFDTTKVSIDYYGMSDIQKQQYLDEHGDPSILAYLPTAIKDQNTLVVFDVELQYKNANPITAGLKIVRNSNDSETVTDYDNDSQHLSGVTSTKNGNDIIINRNPVHASDFYAFYSIFTTTPFEDGLETQGTVADLEALENIVSPEEGDIYQVTDPGKPYRYNGSSWEDASILLTAGGKIWDALHKSPSNSLVKFHNDTDESFLTTIPFPMHLKENEDSLSIPASLNVQDSPTYHCYIGVDYDYEHMRFFMNENRLGKTYYLDRDFGFYFTGEQYLEQGGNQP